VASRCSTAQYTGSICQHHYDVWLYRYKPQTCVACRSPLTSSAYRGCPSWLAEQLHAPRGCFVHKRPCYEEALGRRKQAATVLAEPTAMDVAEQENVVQEESAPFVVNTKREEDTRSYLSAKLQYLSPLKRKADAAATTAIPLTTTHGGHPLHVLLVPSACKPAEEVTSRAKRRRLQMVETLCRLVQPPPAAPPPPVPKLSPVDCMTFRQLNEQLPHRALGLLGLPNVQTPC